MSENQSPAPAPAAANGSDSAHSVATSAAPPPIQNQNSKIQNSRSRTGKVARLPKAIRDRINHLLDDGFTFAQIIRELGDDAHGLAREHIRRWKPGGYQDYLGEQRVIEECRHRSERALDLLRQTGHIHGFQAAQQIATAQICEALADAGPDILCQAFAANPLNYFRMLNAFSRLTTGGLKCERLLDEQAQTAAASQAQPDSQPKKGLSQRTLKEMNDHLHLL